jgi:hypothetical protein
MITRRIKEIVLPGQFTLEIAIRLLAYITKMVVMKFTANIPMANNMLPPNSEALKLSP